MTLRIIKLEIDDYKKIKAGFVVNPEGNLVIVDGKNDQGKTAVLDAIWAALQWGSASKEITIPIRGGETRASVRLELGDETGKLKYTVLRRWTPAGSTLTITDPEGLTKYTSPQKFLDKLIGERSFDPKAFTRLKDKEQVEVLLGTIPDLPFKPAELAEERKTVFDQRTVVGREVTKLAGALANLPEPAADLPLETISLADVLAKVEQIRLHNESVQQRRAEAMASFNAAKALQQQILDASAALLQLKDQLKEQIAEATTLSDELKGVSLLNTEEVDAELATLDEKNAAIRAAQHRRGVAAELAAAKAKVAEQTAELEAIDKRKADALAAVTFPVEGLSFDENGVLYKGFPLNAAGDAVQWRVSCALSMAANPELRMLRVTDGSLLDDDSLAILEELARDKDYQVWLEMVGDRGTDTSMSITIFDGEIVE